MRNLIFIGLVLLCFSCTKKDMRIDQANKSTAASVATSPGQGNRLSAALATIFRKFTIKQGAHYCDQNTLSRVSGTSMNFVAKFDSTAIYPAVITDYNHAYDVNKLWGFSEGFSNQYNSARIGWRWLNGQLQLFAYVYVKGTLLRDPISYDPPFIKSVNIGSEVNCSIAISGSKYIFTVDGVVVQTARGTTSSTYSGYQQYPYFGGTLTAPHLINIYIK
ncbi:MAG TPA: hypothetical protein VGQ53_15360 [Chitinophagaceae bacterium]|jgi:hypothetical protein|nr:hypothetical protein [Chitinophagaceae bacterium]